ncbi:MAG: hypothetical protein H5U40_13285, partial [Polyangiaceae bacterium]|nr:hypothetical protein [Polyangiaceae bacterium]
PVLTGSVSAWFTRLGADPEAVAWARAHGRDWERAWAECPRGDWLLMVAARMKSDPAAIVRAASACARLALPYLPNDEERDAAELSLTQAEDWASRRGSTATLDALAVELDAKARVAPDQAAASALGAAGAALRSASHPDAAPAAAVLAIEAAVLATGECAAASALGFMQHKTADAVRTHIARQLVKGPPGSK